MENQNNCSFNYSQQQQHNNYQTNQQVEIDQSQQNIIYYQRDQLPQYQDGINLQQIEEIITNLMDSKQNWKNQFDAITHLRILNKNFPQYVNTIFTNFGMKILENIEGVKTCVLKNTLLFINEVFISSETTPLNNLIIEKFAPILLQKSIDELKIIQLPAQDALITFSKTCNQYDSAYITMIKTAAIHKSHSVQENALKILQQLIFESKENLIKLHPQTFKMIMQGLTETISSPRFQIKNLSKQVMETMAQVIGNQSYVNMIENVLSNQQQKVIRQNYDEHLSKQTKSKAKIDINQNRKTISLLKAQSKQSIAPILRNGTSFIEIKTSKGEQYQDVLQQQDMNIQIQNYNNYNNNSQQNNNYQQSNNYHFNQNQQNYY